jgi:hypothetical protein
MRRGERGNATLEDREAGLSIEWPDLSPPPRLDDSFEDDDEDYEDYEDEDYEDDEGGSPRRLAALLRGALSPPRWALRQAKRHLSFLSGLRGAWFVLAVGLWALLLKPVLMAASWLLEVELLALGPLFSIRPLEWLAGAISGALVEPASDYAIGAVAAANLLCMCALLPLATTASAQLLPLWTLRERLSRRWLRVTLSLGAMGLLYTLAFGRLGFFVAGAGLGVLLLWAFEARLRHGPRRAFALTFAVHALANAALVLLLVLAGALQ